MKASVRGTELFFDVEGMGLAPDGSRMRQRPVAMLVHGGPGSDHTGFKPSFSPLAERMQLVYFDQRGHGRSARGDACRYTLDESVEDMEALRRYLGLGPIVSIGHSYGGMVAMAHAARHPDSVSHLILVVTASHAGFIARAKEIVRERGTPQQETAAEQLFSGVLMSPEEMRNFYMTMGPLYSRRFDPNVTDGWSNERLIPSPEAQKRGFGPGGFLHRLDLRPELGNITARTLIIAGRHDWITAPEFSEEMHRLIPGSDLRIFENSSHMVRADEQDAMIDAINGFIVYQSSGKGAQTPADS
ncbi:MAG: alpha/beta hydrolase [Alphaproteobacteria bacterium]|nr:alpha/beta hydrolase [Alphaproteobacteria bacterium]